MLFTVKKENIIEGLQKAAGMRPSAFPAPDTPTLTIRRS